MYVYFDISLHSPSPRIFFFAQEILNMILFQSFMKGVCYDSHCTQ
ncbi:hypothetical protein HMPREF0083_03751 [Aneurinibacillus aneurinilyticus ATCC 12856]|uniref:Uncharacterized protein n=1 Tax=Aneurinibacillus aneurinilyticus ATCC 12856 TaxID=649747 RepID=U1YBK5_ANEAE|nr:hypothetical protein HMPREF0083_03751 [Aneurinibacillus aneurinilyticus ATCC 12856]